jgi:hypothetical protein
MTDDSIGLIYNQLIEIDEDNKTEMGYDYHFQIMNMLAVYRQQIEGTDDPKDMTIYLTHRYTNRHDYDNHQFIE